MIDVILLRTRTREDIELSGEEKTRLLASLDVHKLVEKFRPQGRSGQPTSIVVCAMFGFIQRV